MNGKNTFTHTGKCSIDKFMNRPTYGLITPNNVTTFFKFPNAQVKENRSFKMDLTISIRVFF